MKRILWNKKELSHALGCCINYTSLAGITGISIDSRTINKGDMFFALVGNNFNGNDFIDEAIQKGASICFSDNLKNVTVSNIQNVIKVDSIPNTLNRLAKYRRNTLKGRLIAITGSIGKTSTKEMFKSAFSLSKQTFANIKNFNNHYGVPISLIQCPKDVDFCILELGMSAKGEIAHLTNIVKPDIVVITNIHPVHLESFQSIRDIAYAKSEIFKNTNNQGIAILNNKSRYLDVQISEAQKYNMRIFTFGNNKADCYIKSIKKISDKIKNIKIKCFDRDIEQHFQSVVGEHFLYNSLALFICAHICHYNLKLLYEPLKKFEPHSGRGKVIKLRGIILIDESYNSNPEALKTAIRNLKSFKFDGSRLLAIIGDMNELGEKSVNFHKKVKLDGIHKVFCVGNLMKNLYNKMNNSIKGLYTNKAIDMANVITHYITKNDIILVKGSSSMNMKIIVDCIKNKFTI